MSKVFVCGAPGAGKTSTARRLKSALHYPLVEGDYIRECIAPLAPASRHDPFLYISTKQAWHQFGKLQKHNVSLGLDAVRLSAKRLLDDEITLYDNLILEGVFLDLAYSNIGPMFLVVTEDAAQHERQFFMNRKRNRENQEGFQASRLLQELLIEQAANYQIRIIQNTGDADDRAQEIAALLAA